MLGERLSPLLSFEKYLGSIVGMKSVKGPYFSLEKIFFGLESTLVLFGKYTYFCLESSFNLV
jgi:hypothetical protein